MPIADRLAEKGVPFVFTTGYGEQIQLPAVHEGVVVVKKPYTLSSIKAALGRLLGK
jgi:hypothetical protein